MSNWTRRDLLKSGIAASAAVAEQSVAAQSRTGDPAQSTAVPGGGGRERLLLDFGWRFHLGHANDPAQDFGFGNGGGTFAKSGNTVAAARGNFDDSAWRKLDLPHDWAIELPFENNRTLTDHGSHPLGRGFPATSIGWYRRVFNLPASDLGRRIALEFDGVYRDSMVIFNGHYIGNNFSGYAPFRFDVTDQANYGSPKDVYKRQAAGRVVAYSRASPTISSAAMPVSSAARCGVHSRTRSRSPSNPLVWRPT